MPVDDNDDSLTRSDSYENFQKALAAQGLESKCLCPKAECLSLDWFETYLTCWKTFVSVVFGCSKECASLRLLCSWKCGAFVDAYLLPRGGKCSRL